MATLAAPLVGGTVYPGILDLLAALHRVLPMVAITNKPTPLARAVLDAAQVLPFLEGVQGADTPALRKPAPAMLLSACERLGVAPQEMLMVGDSAPDMQSAHAAGCPAVLVGWGYGHQALPAGIDPLAHRRTRPVAHRPATPCAAVTPRFSTPRRPSCPPADDPRSPSS